MLKSILIAAAIVIFGIFSYIKVAKEPSAESQSEDSYAEASQETQSPHKETARRPSSLSSPKASASKKSTPLSGNEIKRSRINNENFTEKAKSTAPDEESYAYSSEQKREIASANDRFIEEPSHVGGETIPVIEPAIPSPPLPPQKAADSGFLSGPFSSTSTSSSSPVNNKKPSDSLINSSLKSSTNTPSSSSGGQGSLSNLSCSASKLSGAFNEPIAVALTCNSPSTIKYCVSYNASTTPTCCDPETDGHDYTTPVKMGSKNGNYCLSYFATSISAGRFDVQDQSYVINSTFPNLLVGHPKTYFQTTELSGTSFINSLDFGKPGYNIGQVNLKEHDPGVSGENLSCEEIATTYGTFLPPVPVDILTLLDVSLDSPSSQIEIPLRPEHLSYGENFIASFIVNNNTNPALYSCSTTKITLSDFEYFDYDLAFGDPGTNTVREFTAGFSPYGFFESETDLNRSPAGVRTSEQSGEKLESGLFGIFF